MLTPVRNSCECERRCWFGSCSTAGMRLWILLFVACTASKPPLDPGDAPGGKGDGDTGPEVGLYIRHEKFDAMPTGAMPGDPWTSDGGVAVREVPFAADKSAELAKPAGAGVASLATMFGAQSGRIVFEAKVLARDTDRKSTRLNSSH